jgi:hypothetical protein
MHPLASWQRAVFLLNSRLSRLAAALRRSGSKSLHGGGHPLSLGYGANLPSSLTWFLSRTLGFSPHPPVSVCGTDPAPSTLRGFSWQPSIGRFALSVDAASRRVSGYMRGGFACRAPYALGLPIPTDSRPSILRHPVAPARKYRNINLLSIDYAFRPRLRIRLTLGGRTCPRKPWDSGGRDSHPTFRYSCPHNHFRTVHGRFHNRFNPVRNAPLPSVLRQIRSFGNGFNSRSFSARDHSTSQLLRTV